MESKCVFLENNKEKCGICYTHSLVECNTQVLECNHKLCKGCFYKLKDKKCPFCRKIINIISPQKKQLPITGSLPTTSPVNIPAVEVQRVSSSLPNYYYLQGSRVGRRIKRRVRGGKGKDIVEDAMIDLDTGRYDDEIFDFEY